MLARQEQDFRPPTHEQIGDMAIALGASTERVVRFRAIDVLVNPSSNPRANRANQIRWPSRDIEEEPGAVVVTGIVEKVARQATPQYFAQPVEEVVVDLRQGSATLPSGETRIAHGTGMAVRLDQIFPGTIEPVREPGKGQKLINKLSKFVSTGLARFIKKQ